MQAKKTERRERDKLSWLLGLHPYALYRSVSDDNNVAGQKLVSKLQIRFVTSWINNTVIVRRI